MARGVGMHETCREHALANAPAHARTEPFRVRPDGSGGWPATGRSSLPSSLAASVAASLQCSAASSSAAASRR